MVCTEGVQMSGARTASRRPVLRALLVSAALFLPVPLLPAADEPPTPAAADSDRDGLPDAWEETHGLDPSDPGDADRDPDGDGLPSRREFELGTDPRAADTDRDGLDDGAEIDRGADPRNPDTDRDGLLDGWEIDGTDFDGDGAVDPAEDLPGLGADPLRPDLFVQVDWVVSPRDALGPDPAAFAATHLAFAGGPLPGAPDGPAVAVHFDARTVPVEEILHATADAPALEEALRARPASFWRMVLFAMASDPGRFPVWRRNVFHYALIAESRALLPGGPVSGPDKLEGDAAFAERFHTPDDRAAGLADPGTMAILLLRDRLGDAEFTGRTLLHEIGHAIGLGHGGAFGPFAWDDRNYKPNYPSVMNYDGLLGGLAAFSRGREPVECGPCAPIGPGDACTRDHDDWGKLIRDGFDGTGRNAFRGAEGMGADEQARLLLEEDGSLLPRLLLRGRGGLAVLKDLACRPRIAMRIPATGSALAPWTGDRIFAGPFGDEAPELLLEGIPLWRAVRLEDARSPDGRLLAPELQAVPVARRAPGGTRGRIRRGRFTRHDPLQLLVHTAGGADGAGSRLTVLEFREDRMEIAWDGAGGAADPGTIALLGAIGPHAGLLAADLDGDGLDDVLLRDRLLGRAALLRGAKGGMARVPIASAGVPGPRTSARIWVADLDGDGAEEILALEASAGSPPSSSIDTALWEFVRGVLVPRGTLAVRLAKRLVGDRWSAAVGRFSGAADGEEIIVHTGGALLLLRERRGTLEVGAVAAERIERAPGPAGRERSLAPDDRILAISRRTRPDRPPRSDLLHQAAGTIAVVRATDDGFLVIGEIGDDAGCGSWLKGRMLAADADGDGAEDLLLRHGELHALYLARGPRHDRYGLGWLARFDGDALTWEVLSPFRRGDANGDATVDVGDAIVILFYLFVGGQPPPCLDAADADDSGVLDIADPIYLLGYLFLDGTPPPPPGPERPGLDPTEDPYGCNPRGLGCPAP